MKLLESYSKGVSAHGIDIKTQQFKRLKKWHFFANGVSLCGKYKQVKNDNLLPAGMIHSHEMCAKCRKILKKILKEEN